MKKFKVTLLLAVFFLFTPSFAAQDVWTHTVGSHGAGCSFQLGPKDREIAAEKNHKIHQIEQNQPLANPALSQNDDDQDSKSQVRSVIF